MHNGEYQIIYKIREGDTLSDIAVRFQCSVRDIITLNPCILNPNIIFPGMVLLMKGYYHAKA